MRKITAVFLSLMMAFTSLNVFVYAESETDEPVIEETETVIEEETEIEPEESSEEETEEEEEPKEEEPEPEEEEIPEEETEVADEPEETDTPEGEEIVEEAEEQEMHFESALLGPVGTKVVDDSGTDPGLSGSNIDYNDYSIWTKPDYSYITTVSGGYMIVTYIGDGVWKALYYNNNYVLQKTVTLSGQLPYFGGFYETDNYYFIVTGQSNLNESASVECYRITKYDKDWNETRSIL